MLITREIDYAVRILRSLTDGEVHSVKPLCAEEAVPTAFAYKILGKLKDAGYVRSIAGARGGCQLCADLHEVTLLDLVVAIDGPLVVNKCMEEGYVCEWTQKKGKPCMMHENLFCVQHEVEELLRSHTLYDMLSDGSEQADISEGA